MTDVHSKSVRSRNMAAIRSRNTQPERLIRSAARKAKLRFRSNVAWLPGRPDLVLIHHHVAILVHGCFWHGHDCAFFKLPKSRQAFWSAKIEANRQRDRRVKMAILDQGWRLLIIWQCALRKNYQRNGKDIAKRIERWVLSKQRVGEIRA